MVFSRLHRPWLFARIVAGIIIGPHSFGRLETDSTIDFLAETGLIFLMFMVGLEVRLSSLKRIKGKVAKIFILNGGIPFLVGIGLGMYFGLGSLGSLLLGTIFISSSIAVVVPSLRASRVLGTRLGKSIISSTVLQDIVSLVILSILLQTTNSLANIPLPLFYLLLLAALVGIRWVTPKIHKLFHSGREGRPDQFEQELRAIVTTIIGTVIILQLLGVHAIIAGFFTGFVLSDVITSQVIKEKLHAIAYGLFIPIFFVVVGLKTDISVFYEVSGAILFTGLILVGSIGSKFISGWLGGRLAGFNSKESALIGSASIAQLSTTLAVVFAASELKILDSSLVTAMVVLSIVTTFLAPLLVRHLSGSASIEKTRQV